MADNFAITVGSGTAIAAENVSSVFYQKIKLIDPTASSTTGIGNAANPMQVSLANHGANATAVKVDGSAVTQPVSLATLPVTNAGTFAVQAAQSGTWTVQPGNTANTTAWKVDGSAVTQPASIADGSLTTLGAKADAKSTATDTTSVSAMSVLKQISASVQAPPSQAVTNGGTFAVQATLQANSGVDIGKLTANQSVNVSQINGVTPLMGAGNTGTGSQRVTIATDQAVIPVGGTVATNVAITANPLNLGAQAVSSENSAVTTARQVQLVADLVGKLIVLPYANPENFVSGCISSAMTGTTSTSLVASPGGSLRNYITTIIASCAHATQGTDILIQDGSGGTTLAVIPAAALYGGAAITFPTPLRQPTTATAIYAANVTTGSSTKITALGYKGL